MPQVYRETKQFIGLLYFLRRTDYAGLELELGKVLVLYGALAGADGFSSCGAKGLSGVDMVCCFNFSI